MTHDSFDQPPGGNGRDRTQTTPSKRRKGLRVPISGVPHRSVIDELSTTGESGSAFLPASAPPKPLVDEAPSGVIMSRAEAMISNAGRSESPMAREPTIPSFPLNPESQRPPAIEVHPSEPAPPREIRNSEPPEELSLEDAEVVHVPPPPPPRKQPTPKALPVKTTDPDWYKDFFGEHYLRTVRTPTPREVATECDLIERALAVLPGSTILDVGSGLGLNAIELTARGYKVLGLDISDTMVSRAQAEARDRNLQTNFIVGDIRTIELDTSFDAVLCWGTTFGYFDELENNIFVQSCFDALKPGGAMLLEVANRDHLIGLQPNQVWFEVDGSICMEETDFDYRSSRLRVRRKVVSDQGDQSNRECSIRLYSLHEMSWMLEAHGFRVDQISGRRAALGVFFGAESPHLIVRAERGSVLFSQNSIMPPHGKMHPTGGSNSPIEASIPPPSVPKEAKHTLHTAPTEKYPAVPEIDQDWNAKTVPDLGSDD